MPCSCSQVMAKTTAMLGSVITGAIILWLLVHLVACTYMRLLLFQSDLQVDYRLHIQTMKLDKEMTALYCL